MPHGRRRRSPRRKSAHVARLRVLAVSARLPAWAETACADYARRMPKGYDVERIAVKNESRLRAALPKGARVIVLDEQGRELTTAQFAKLLQAPSAFVIGGADGLSAATKGEADSVLRLSARLCSLVTPTIANRIGPWPAR
ncbi:MAG: hypothetical protein E6H57_10670 [Betaproteobacteria bacterium]|nr:MAG: hypothetical protein E6H57_10670 [Betaproteobacteria bacterium]